LNTKAGGLAARIDAVPTPSSDPLCGPPSPVSREKDSRSAFEIFAIVKNIVDVAGDFMEQLLDTHFFCLPASRRPIR
jgi:hypothetical protein